MILDRSRLSGWRENREKRNEDQEPNLGLFAYYCRDDLPEFTCQRGVFTRADQAASSHDGRTDPDEDGGVKRRSVREVFLVVGREFKSVDSLINVAGIEFYKDFLDISGTE